MKDIRRINVAVIGTGWCGGIRAVASAASPWVNDLHIAEINEDRLKEVAAQTRPATATTDYRRIVENPAIDAVMISTTPEGTHYPIAKESMLAGKHVLLEKPIAIELAEADELIAISREKKVAFSIAYSQRFNPKFVYVKRSLEDGTIGEPVSALVSRHITRNLGKKISGRVKLSPAAMESTHDIDFTMWCLAPRKPVRVYAQEAAKIMKAQYDAPDQVWMIITMDDGTVVTIGGGWVLPPASTGRSRHGVPPTGCRHRASSTKPLPWGSGGVRSALTCGRGCRYGRTPWCAGSTRRSSPRNSNPRTR